MYIKKEVDGSTLFACLYVDDLIFIGNNPTMFKDLKKLWYKSLRWQTLVLDLKIHKKDEIFCVLEWLCQRHS